MLFKKLWRTMGLYKVQFISMILMTTLGLGVFVGFHMEWYTLDTRTADFNRETGMADYRIYSETSFSEEEAEKIGKISGVDAYSRFMSMVVGVKGKEEDTLSLTVTENEAVSGFLVTAGDAYDKKDTEGIWLSDKYALANDVNIGDTMTLSIQNVEIKGIVRGLIKSSEYTICVRDSSQLMPDYNTHGYGYISPAMYEEVMPMAFYPALHIISQEEDTVLEEQVEKVLGCQPHMISKDYNVSYAGPQGEIDEGKTMATLLPTVFLVIAILSMVTTMHRIASQEKTQIGTLKALGFKDRRILRHYTSYAVMIGLMGAVLGSALGFFLCGMIMDPEGPMGAYMDMPNWDKAFPMFTVPVMVLILIGLAFIGYLSTRSMLRGTAADALRPYTPKKMKPLMVEKTKWFHKLSFGTRWNMRDTFRHKARTLMSVFGVMSCMIIILACFGMRDTVNTYLEDSYYPSMNYESRIYLSADAAKDERSRLIEQYGRDTSSTISVKVENDKAVSLYQYHLEGDSVGFIGEDANPITLGDDGAYICIRIADAYGLKTGDTISVSPYGTDDTYELKVAGLVRSTLEESILMTDTYAEEIGLTYTPDSIYSQTKSEQIEETAAIATVQSCGSVTSSFDSFVAIMNSMIFTFIGVAVILGIVVLYNLGVMTYTERYRELATLKVVGFKDKQIAHLLHGQTFSFTITGMVLGLPIAVALLHVLMNELAAEYEMVPSLSVVSYVLSICITLGVSGMVSLMTSRKNKKIDMVAALKNAE